MTRLELDVVVSRYNENVSWTFGLPDHANLFLYNKGTDLHSGIPLPALGGDAHTYLHHILAVYNKLSNYESDYIAFLKPEPFKTCPDALHQLISKSYAGADFTPLGNFRPLSDMQGRPHHDGLDLKMFAKELLHFDLPEHISFTAGSQFVIHKRAIQKYPLEFYWNLYVNTVAYPNMEFMLERTWERIFNR